MPEVWSKIQRIPFSCDPQTMSQLEANCAALFRSLGLQDYARMDFRFDDAGKLYLLDVNPNNWIGGHFRKAGSLAGMEWPQLLDAVLSSAVRRVALQGGGNEKLTQQCRLRSNIQDPLSTIQELEAQLLNSAGLLAPSLLGKLLLRCLELPTKEQAKGVELLVQHQLVAKEDALNSRCQPPRADNIDKMEAAAFERLSEDEYEYADQVSMVS